MCVYVVVTTDSRIIRIRNSRTYICYMFNGPVTILIRLNHGDNLGAGYFYRLIDNSLCDMRNAIDVSDAAKTVAANPGLFMQ